MSSHCNRPQIAFLHHRLQKKKEKQNKKRDGVIGKNWQSLKYFSSLSPTISHLLYDISPGPAPPWWEALPSPSRVPKTNLEGPHLEVIETIPNRSFTKSCIVQLTFYWNGKDPSSTFLLGYAIFLKFRFLRGKNSQYSHGRGSGFSSDPDLEKNLPDSARSGHWYSYP